MNFPPAGRPPEPAASPLAKLRREGETLLVYAGGFTPNRGLENVVRAMNMLERCRLVMLGWGSLESELRALASDRVVFHPPVGPDDVVPVIAGADIGIAPYLPIGRNNELAEPNKIFEYMHAGLAIAASDVPEMRRIIELHGVGEFLDSGTPNATAVILMGLLSRLDQRKSAARAAVSIYLLGEGGASPTRSVCLPPDFQATDLMRIGGRRSRAISGSLSATK